MNIASIDIGSNTVLLLIAKVDLNTKKITPIFEKYEIPRISQGLTQGGRIGLTQITKLLIVLKQYKTLINKYNCVKTIITATNALRIASNTDKIIDKIQSDLGLNVKVVSGEEEAKLSFLSAASSFNSIPNKLIIDIGGGSTEIILGENDAIIYKKSFPIGVVGLTEKCISNEIPTENELLCLKNICEKTFEEVKKVILNKFETYQYTVIGVAGTPTTLMAIKQNLIKYDNDKIEGKSLTLNELLTLYNSFSKVSPKNILRKYGEIVRGREDLILTGTLILYNLLKTLKKDGLFVSGKGIRYGAIIDYLKNI